MRCSRSALGRISSRVGQRRTNTDDAAQCTTAVSWILPALSLLSSSSRRVALCDPLLPLRRRSAQLTAAAHAKQSTTHNPLTQHQQRVSNRNTASMQRLECSD